MPRRPSAASTPKQTEQPSALILNPEVRQKVYSLLGLGLRYNDWSAALQNLGLSASEIPPIDDIKREEFEYFKDEIIGMLQEKCIRYSSKEGSNSYPTIIKRLQGTWLDGSPASSEVREERKTRRRLLSPDAKHGTLRICCMRRWFPQGRDGLKGASPFSRSTTQDEESPEPQRSGPLRHSPTLGDTSQEQHPAATQPGHFADQQHYTTTNSYRNRSLYKDEPQEPVSGVLPFPTRQDNLAPNTINPALLTSIDAVTAVHDFPEYSAWNSNSFGQANIPFSSSNVDTEGSLMQWQNDQNSHSGFTQYGHADVDLGIPNILNSPRYETNAGSGGHHDLQHTGTLFPQRIEPVSRGTFCDAYQSVYMDDYPSFSMINETVAQDVDTLPETMLVSTAQQTISSSDFREVASEVTTAHHPRKRPRHRKRGRSSASSSTGSADVPATNVILTKDGTIKDSVTSQGSKKSFFSGMMSNTSQSKARNGKPSKKQTIALLEEDLQRERSEHWRTIEEHKREKEDHRKTRETLDLANERLEAAMSQVSDLQAKIENMRILSKHLVLQSDEETAFNKLQEELGQRSIPQRAQSNLSQYTDGTGNSDHPLSSRTAMPRPLSILGAGISDRNSDHHSRNLACSRNPPAARGRFPIATDTSSTLHASAVSSRRTSTISSSLAPASDIPIATHGYTASATSHARPCSSHSCKVNEGLKKLKHKLSNLSNRGREESSSAPRPDASQHAPTLPPVAKDVPLRRQMSGILNDAENRNTGHSLDSGYGPSFEEERAPGSPPPGCR